MEDMNKEEEWLASLLKENTKLHHMKSMDYFKEFTRISPEEMLDLRRREGRRFNTRIVLFWKWMQNKKDLSASTSSSYVFGISSFFSYYDLDLKLKGKIPDTKMKIEKYQPTLEDTLKRVWKLRDFFRPESTPQTECPHLATTKEFRIDLELVEERCSQCGKVLGHYSVERAERQDRRKDMVIYTSLNRRERASSEFIAFELV